MRYPDDTDDNTGFWRKVTSLETSIDEVCRQTMYVYSAPWDSNSLEVNFNCVKVETCEEQ
jgi:hypothetical protein